jgi:hypothetical protein
LRYTNEDHRIAHRPLTAQLLRPLILGLLALEMKQRDPFTRREAFDRSDKLPRDLTQERR